MSVVSSFVILKWSGHAQRMKASGWSGDPMGVRYGGWDHAFLRVPSGGGWVNILLVVSILVPPFLHTVAVCCGNLVGWEKPETWVLSNQFFSLYSWDEWMDGWMCAVEMRLQLPFSFSFSLLHFFTLHLFCPLCFPSLQYGLFMTNCRACCLVWCENVCVRVCVCVYLR
ncbi:uncharacterized protein BDR25DRAFT_45705 [Lindgomyces ingoldianus]|uniref:Uncharacterized protein n=1 Tax=Lindgomyces ingoldianus TaxID=673940 RepID=A0ACB6RG80_9PLEO|nr:uncharacterized protein BDR25DRAFT_45705 [Lindgomyces ingoldianus]KAF2477335.1 hypothetical protein BDR25DRAFT_45705 [Lindgomyces ingoldianus]